MGKQQEREKEAVLSCDANRILLVCKRISATALYYVGLNAVTANKMRTKELLKKRGIGKATVRDVRWANERAYIALKYLESDVSILRSEIDKLNKNLLVAKSHQGELSGEDLVLSEMTIEGLEETIGEKVQLLKELELKLKKIKKK